MPGNSRRRESDISVGGQLGSEAQYSPVVTAHHIQTETLQATERAQLKGITTAERDALTASNGMLIYNSTLNKFQGYENGAWTNLT